MEKLLKISEVARKLGLHKATLKRWVQSGLGPVVSLTPGGHYLFKESDILIWQESLKSRGCEKKSLKSSGGSTTIA